MVSNILLFSPRTLGKWSNLTFAYFFKWVETFNHQPVISFGQNMFHGWKKQNHQPNPARWFTLQETNISPKNGILKMIFLFPSWDMLIPWRVDVFLQKTGQVCAANLAMWMVVLLTARGPRCIVGKVEGWDKSWKTYRFLEGFFGRKRRHETLKNTPTN